jgi:hypothetical protein
MQSENASPTSILIDARPRLGTFPTRQHRAANLLQAQILAPEVTGSKHRLFAPAWPMRRPRLETARKLLIDICAYSFAEDCLKTLRKSVSSIK